MESKSPEGEPRWFVVYTKPRAEEHAEEHLRRQAFTTYLPRMRESRHHRGRWRENIVPMFPRYLFLHLLPGVQDISAIRSTRGVTSLVTFGQQLAVMPCGMVEALRSSEDPHLGAHALSGPLFSKGDRISIVQGPFAGLEGVFQAPTGEERVIILLNILGREASPVALPLAHIKPLEEKIGVRLSGSCGDELMAG